MVAAASGGETHTARSCVDACSHAHVGERGHTTLEPLGPLREGGRKEEPTGILGASLEGWLGVDLGR